MPSPHNSVKPKRKPKSGKLSNRVRWTTGGLGIIRGGSNCVAQPQFAWDLVEKAPNGSIQDYWLDLEWLLIYKQNLEMFTEDTRILRSATDDQRVEIDSAAKILLTQAARLTHFATGSPIESLNPFSPASA